MQETDPRWTTKKAQSRLGLSEKIHKFYVSSFSNKTKKCYYVLLRVPSIFTDLHTFQDVFPFYLTGYADILMIQFWKLKFR